MLIKQIKNMMIISGLMCRSPGKKMCGRARDRAAGTGYSWAAPYPVFPWCAAAGYRDFQIPYLYRFAHGGPAGGR